MGLSARPPGKRPKALARLLFLLYALRLLAPRLVVMAALTFGGGLLVKLRRDALTDEPVDFIAACYEVYTQLFFEHVSGLPDDNILRLLFFVVPLVGALVLAEGLFKLGASLLDFKNHRDEWMRIMAKTYSGHVVLIGLGHVGFRVLEELLARDVPVVVIEARDEGPFIEEARAQGVPVLVGDARRESLLAEVGVARAAALIACTDDDLVNLEAALDARHLNPGIRLVMRMFDQKMAQKISGAFALDSTFSTSAIAAPTFAAAALDERVYGAYHLGETMMVTMELFVEEGSPLAGQSIAAVEQRLGVPLVGVRRMGGGPTHRFERGEVLKEGDGVLCHVPVDAIHALKQKARERAA